MKIRIDARVAIAIGAAAAIALVSLARRRRDSEDAGAPRKGAEAPCRIDAAPLVVVRAERGVITIASTEGARVEVSSPGARDLDDVVEASREGEGARLILEAQPRRALRILLPAGSALRLEVARSSVRVKGLDDVDVHCVRSSVALRDVAGKVAIDSARAAVKVDLARDRQTRSVDLSAARSALSLVLPPDRGGSYDVRTARSSVVHPAPVEGGIPFVVEAARASIAIRVA
jgi:hypothetical protein